MLNEKELGKIKKVRFGSDGDGRFGLHLDFSINGGSAGCGWSRDHWVRRPEHAKWSEQDRREEFGDLCLFIIELLQKTGKRDVYELAGTPVELTFEGNTLKSWRVLEEVL